MQKLRGGREQDPSSSMQAWLSSGSIEEDDSDKAHAALQSWVTQDITRIAPHLMPFEVANALHRRVLRGELNVGRQHPYDRKAACVEARTPSAAGAPR